MAAPPRRRPHARCRRLPLLLVAAVLWPSLGAQAPTQSSARPRIGLVLSGGGARGAAHAGVLHVLEELRIPVDCVVGTSMGAIVGGLYAYGLSPDQLAASLTREGSPHDWADLLRDGPRREDFVFRRKEDERKFLSNVRIGVRDGELAFPKGLLVGQNLEVELHALTLEAHSLRSFDDLPLPFRCVAVDIHKGESVVLGSGSLPEAIRASMSLPGIFTPVVIGGRELVDGGLLNNVPVDVARALGVDVLIVVDIGTPLEMDKAIQDLFSVTGQMVAVLTEQNVRNSRSSLGPDDVLITPSLGDITSADFTRAAESIAIGAVAARAAVERLRRYSVPEAEYAQFLRRQRRQAQPPPRIRSVQVTSASGLGLPVLEARLEVTAGQPFDPAALRAGIDRLYGTDDLERVTFDLRNWRDGEADLALRVEEKSWGPSYMRLGVGLESSLRGESTFNISGQYNSRVLDSLGAEWRTKVQLGNNNFVDTEYYQPLEASGTWFVAPRLAAQQFAADLFQDGQRIADVDVGVVGMALDAGAQIGRWAELRFGLSQWWGDVRERFAIVPIDSGTFDDTVGRVQLQVDTLDNPRFPRYGSLGNLEWRAGLAGLGADARYQQLAFAWTQAVPVGPRTSVLPRVRLTTTLQNEAPAYIEPTIGGLLNLSGYARDAFRDQHTGLLALVGHHRLSQTSKAFGFPLYVGGSIEAGNAWSTRADFFGTFRLAGSVFLGVDTPLGPCLLGYGQAEGGERAVYFFLGQF
ncbi:MAG: patatin-like phospholipase family protein [Planctomycetes bacterium]|nr:patatin-like phospholipase family protein [Planctomycetota bacterium]